MRKTLRIIKVGLSLSLVLAVFYVIVLISGLVMVGLGTTRSWQAFLLGISWSSLAGFGIGFLGIVIAGFSIATVLVLLYYALQRLVAGRSNIQVQASTDGRLTGSSWQTRLLAACLVLPPLVLFGLRLLALSSTSQKEMIGSDGSLRVVNLGSTFNTAYRESEPSFTADGRTMYFNCRSGDICVSHLDGAWEEGKWTTPELLDAPVNTEYEEVEPLINAKGDKLYFTSIRPLGRLSGVRFLSPFLNVIRVVNTLSTARLGRTFFGGMGLADVYVSYLVNGAWLEPRSLGEISGMPLVNTPFHDHCLFFSADGDEAFWTSTRPGGFGGNDIWTSRRVGDVWTEPENLGQNVNGPGDEHTSIPTPDGRSLYVTAVRSEGFGEDDIYITTREDGGAWGPLSNLGPLVNGPYDDRCPAWTPDLKIFLFDSVREGGFGSRDIWWVYFEEILDHPLAAASASPGFQPHP